MTAFTQEAARAEEVYTPRVNNACATISGRGECSRSPIPARQRARPVEQQIDDWKSITTTMPPKRIQAFRSEATSVSPATRRRNQEELKELLLEGWEKGWLAMKPPDCAHGPPQAA